MLVLSSASPWFHWISACPGEQTLDSRNKWQKSKLLLVSWLVLSCLLVSQWHLTVRPWIKHLVRMLDGSTFGVFSKQFFWNKTYILVLELWGAATSVLPWRGVWGWLCGCRHCSRIQVYPWHCSLQVLLTHSSFCADECCDPGRAVFWVIPVFGTSRACKYCLICWALYSYGTWSESYREGCLGDLALVVMLLIKICLQSYFISSWTGHHLLFLVYESNWSWWCPLVQCVLLPPVEV